MGRRTRTLVAAALLAVALGVFATTVPVPMVALGPGPTFDTLGEVDGTTVVAVDGLEVYPTSGRLNMTTVAVTDRLTMMATLGYWLADERQVVPRSQVFPPGLSDAEVERENTLSFAASEVNAEVAAMTQLGLATRAVVADVVPDSAAVGVLEVGDQLLVVNGTPVGTPAEVSEALAGTAPGESVELTYRRGADVRETTVVLGASPDRDRGLLGVRPGVDPVGGDVTISLGDIGGPSAGLIFALSLVDKLTPGELTGGRFVAGTGAITADGAVQPIGGIPFKMAAARAAGATVFLVPAENCAEALATAPPGLQLVRVASLDEAVAGLDALREARPAPTC